MKKENRIIAENELRIKAEAIILREDKGKNNNLKKLSFEEINSIVHELEVYQIELEMQNEELRKTQLELEHLKAKYFDIYDLAPVGYLIISEKGIILEVNLTAAVMFGESRNNLEKKPITKYIFSEDQDIYYKYRKELFEFKQPIECELRMLREDHKIFLVHMMSTVVNEDDELTCRMVIRDI